MRNSRLVRPGRWLLGLLSATLAVVLVQSVAVPSTPAVAAPEQPGSPAVLPWEGDTYTLWATNWTMTSPSSWGFRWQQGNEPALLGTSGTMSAVYNRPGFYNPPGGWNQGGCHHPVFYDRWGNLRDSATGRMSVFGPNKQAASWAADYSNGNTSAHLMANGVFAYYNPNYVCVDPYAQLNADTVYATNDTPTTFDPVSNDVINWTNGNYVQWTSLPKGTLVTVPNTRSTFRWYPAGSDMTTTGTYRICGTARCTASATVTFYRSGNAPGVSDVEFIAKDGAAVNTPHLGGTYSSGQRDPSTNQWIPTPAPCLSINASSLGGTFSPGSSYCAYDFNTSWSNTTQRVNDQKQGSFSVTGEFGTSRGSATFTSKMTPVTNPMVLRTSGKRPVEQRIPANLFSTYCDSATDRCGRVTSFSTRLLSYTGDSSALSTLSLINASAGTPGDPSTAALRWTPVSASPVSAELEYTICLDNDATLCSSSRLTMVQSQVQPS